MTAWSVGNLRLGVPVAMHHYVTGIYATTDTTYYGQDALDPYSPATPDTLSGPDPAIVGVASQLIYDELGAQWVAVGRGGIATSPDFITWTTRLTATLSPPPYNFALAYDGSQYIVSDTTSSDIYRSTDCHTWTLTATDASLGQIQRIVGSGSLWLAGCQLPSGTPDVMMSSPDGVTWTVYTPSHPDFPGDSLFGYGGMWYGNGLFVANAQSTDGGYNIWTSTDGVNWTPAATQPWVSGGVNNRFQSVVWNGSVFVAVGFTSLGGAFVWSSPDGSNWTDQSSTSTFVALGFNNASSVWWDSVAGQFIVEIVSTDFSGSGYALAFSADGATWTTSALYNPTGPLQVLGFVGNKW